MPKVLPHAGPVDPPRSQDDPLRSFQADRFTLAIGPDWIDRTAYVLRGPLEHDLQHLLTVALDEEAGDVDLLAYAYPQVDGMLETLKGCRCQARGLTTLDCGVPAYFAAFVWWPADERRLYQELWFVLHAGTGYRLAATFTRKTRRTLGPAVRRAVHAFLPAAAPPPSGSAASFPGPASAR
jgi:hypothetical protein